MTETTRACSPDVIVVVELSGGTVVTVVTTPGPVVSVVVADPSGMVVVATEIGPAQAAVTEATMRATANLETPLLREITSNH
ncbi:MAG: hypothetical protein WCA93_08995 [Acidimicrobiia bacterium]